MNYLAMCDNLIMAGHWDRVDDRKVCLTLDARRAQASALEDMGLPMEALEVDSRLYTGLKREKILPSVLVRRASFRLSLGDGSGDDPEALEVTKEDLLFCVERFWETTTGMPKPGWMQEKLTLNWARRAYFLLVEVYERMGNKAQAEEAQLMVDKLDEEDELHFQVGA